MLGEGCLVWAGFALAVLLVGVLAVAGPAALLVLLVVAFCVAVVVLLARIARRLDRDREPPEPKP